MMRESPLRSNPSVGRVTLALLLGIAHAIESESLRRYQTLARAMRQRGETATAEAFEAMLQEEKLHLETIRSWAQGLGQPLPDAADYAWCLPPEIGSSWDEVSQSARLTPYRAFAIAVQNEQRAFALYSYLAAQAADPAVAAQAERLAHEELQHAAQMRRLRRRAWHAERRGEPSEAAEPTTVGGVGELRALIERHEGRIAARHRELAVQLRGLGDPRSARLLEAAEGGEPAPDAAGPSAASAPLLAAALEPLEAFSDTLESLLLDGDGPLLTLTEQAHAEVVRRIAGLEAQIERCSGP